MLNVCTYVQMLTSIFSFAFFLVQEVTEESRELLRQALEEEEEIYQKRCELIQQIRAIEHVPFLNSKFVDLTQVSS